MEELILVNYDDEEIGYMDKTYVHREGLLHRAFSVFIVHNGKMLIQKRNIRKYHSGGLWANACCSHPRKGEELQQAVHRRLQEELGFDCEVRELCDFVKLNEEEASEIKWIDIEELKELVVNKPERFASWFLIALQKVIRCI